MFFVSVLIRNRNEGELLRLVLSRLREQKTNNLEIVVVDNDSTDRSRDYIRDFGCRLVELPAGQFTYGRATNLGVENCSGQLILMLSSHSLPIGTYFIDEVTARFTDARVAAVRIPMAANTSEFKNFSQFAPLDGTSTAEEIFRRGPVASGSVFRRSIWARHRFDETLIAAEDKEWAMRVLREGSYIMPIANAAYCYMRSFEPESWRRKLRREETAGFTAARICRVPSLKEAVLSTLSAQRDVFRKARTEAALYALRRRLYRLRSA